LVRTRSLVQILPENHRKNHEDTYKKEKYLKGFFDGREDGLKAGYHDGLKDREFNDDKSRGFGAYREG
jgi:hypothetical protein